MNLFEILFRWWTFATMLGALVAGGEADSPPFYFTYQDGRKFEVNFHAKRVG